MNFFKKPIASVLILAIILPMIMFSLPQRADAQVATIANCFGFGLGDLFGKAKEAISEEIFTEVTGVVSELATVPVSNIKEEKLLVQIDQSTGIVAQKQTCLDQIATMIAKKILRSLTDSIVNWAASGFDGNPVFISDVGGFFRDIGDEIAGDFIENSDLNFLCSPFRLDIQLGLSRQRAGQRSYFRCTLSDVVKNIENFTIGVNGNFNENGGWSGWYSMTQYPQNNPYGAQFLAEQELKARLSARIGQLETELSWGNGFFSYKDAKGNIITPGATIEKAISDAVGTDLKQLEMAQEFDEIINAITGALLKKALGGVGLIKGA